jgi:hypothetical protein
MAKARIVASIHPQTQEDFLTLLGKSCAHCMCFSKGIVMLNLALADELAEIRAEIARLKLREAVLRAQFLADPTAPRRGRWHRVEVEERQAPRFNPPPFCKTRATASIVWCRRCAACPCP